MAARRIALSTAAVSEAPIGMCEACGGERLLTSSLDIVAKHTRRCRLRVGNPDQITTDQADLPVPPAVSGPAADPLDVELPDPFDGPPDYERHVTVITSRQRSVTGHWDRRGVRIARYGAWWIVELHNGAGAMRPGARTRDEAEARRWANDEWMALRKLAEGSKYWEVARTR